MHSPTEQSQVTAAIEQLTYGYFVEQLLMLINLNFNLGTYS